MKPMEKLAQRRGGGRVNFLACAAAIFAELDRGWPMTAVFEKFSDRLGVSYWQFGRYVRAHRARRDASQPAAARRPAPTSALAPPPTPDRPGGGRGQPGGGHGQRQFKYDPAVDRNELI